MTAKLPRLLYLAHRIPYPPNKGDKIRAFHQLRHLSATHDIDLVCLADTPGEEKYAAHLQQCCRRVFVEPIQPLLAKVRGLAHLASGGTVSVGYFFSGQVQRVVEQWLAENSYAAIICYSSVMAEYVLRSTRLSRVSPPRLIMDFCDVDSDKWLQYAREAKFPLKQLYAVEGKRLLAFEGEINRRFDHSIFVSEKEAELFSTLYPAARNVSVVPNGVDHAFFAPAPVHGATTPAAKERGPLLLFTGAMDYHANVDAVSWFCNEIFPAVRQKLDACRFCIVGSKPSARVRELGARSGVQVTGFVEDIRPYYQAADISVVPMRLGRGVQNKVLEAMAMGKAVITTAKAADGIRARCGEHLLVEDTAAGFARAVLDLTRDPQARAVLGKSARRFILEHFDWGGNVNRLSALLGEGALPGEVRIGRAA